jgi:homoserine kinase
LALEIVCRVQATVADRWEVVHRGAHGPGPNDDDAVLRAARMAVGDDHPLKLDVDNEIPLGRGLGSSAAAFVAGAAAALRAVEGNADPSAVLRIAASLEGHVDNVAASVHGGLVAALGSSAHSLELHPSLRIVLAVPARRLPTKWAREALPEVVDHEVAARSVARAVALVEGFRTGDPELFGAAAGDELHEGPRGPLFPEADDLMYAARSAGAFHACWSGAGPSILAVTDAGHVAEVTAALNGALAGDGTALTPDVARRGLR